MHGVKSTLGPWQRCLGTNTGNADNAHDPGKSLRGDSSLFMTCNDVSGC